MYVKEGFSFYILYGLKIWQNFEMEICLLREEEKGEHYQKNFVNKPESYLLTAL